MRAMNNEENERNEESLNLQIFKFLSSVIFIIHLTQVNAVA